MYSNSLNLFCIFWVNTKMNNLYQIIVPLLMTSIFVGVYIYERYRATNVSETKEPSTMDSKDLETRGKIDISKFLCIKCDLSSLPVNWIISINEQRINKY